MARIAGLSIAVASDLNVTDDLTVTDVLTVNGNCTIGNAVTDTLGFYGSTAVSQPADAAQAAVSTSAPVQCSATAAIYGFATATQFNAVIALCNAMRAALVPTTGTGIMKGGA